MPGCFFLFRWPDSGRTQQKKFRHRVAANLQPKLVEVNVAKDLCNRVPSVTELEKMIAQAKEMEPAISY